MERLLLRAYGKINIGLNIISNRHDGYHNIETILQQIDLYDLVFIEGNDRSKIQILMDNTIIANNEENICYRAVKLMQQATGIDEGVTVKIQKRIPIGSGLGGGSSDAAAVLLGLQRRWRILLKEAELKELARQLGADVPFFQAGGGTALAWGIGDKLRPLRLPWDFYCALIYPNIEISTRWAYKNFNFILTKTKKSIKLSHIFFERLPVFALRNIISNDLEEVVFQKFPQLRDVKMRLYRNGALFACMSGSGSTIYGLFKSYTQAVMAVRSFQRPYQIILAKPMNTRNLP